MLQDAGAETVVADLSQGVEWTAEGCNALTPPILRVTID